MTSDLFNLQDSAQNDLGNSLHMRFGSHLADDTPALPTMVPAGMQGQMDAYDQQLAAYSNYKLNVAYQNASTATTGSAGIFLLHPDQIEAASAELDERELRAEMGANQFSEQSFNQLVDMARKYPRIDAGVLQAMAQAQISDTSPDGQHILQQAAEKKYIDDLGAMQGKEVTPEKIMSTLGPKESQELDFWSSNPVGNAIKAGVRTALAVPIGAAEAFSAGISAAFMEAQGSGDAGQTLEQLGEAGGGGTLAELLRGAIHEDEDVQLGSGFLPQQGGSAERDDGTVMSEGEEVTKRLLSHEGRWLSPGRVVAESLHGAARDWFGWNIVAPGSTPYNAVSWMADTSIQLAGANPGNLISDLPAATLAARKSFAGTRGRALLQGTENLLGLSTAKQQVADLQAGTRGLREILTEGIGGIRGTRAEVDAERAVAWLQTPDGNKLAEYIAGQNSITALKRTPGIDLKTARLLKDAKSPVEVKDILEPLMGTHITVAPPVPGMLGGGTAFWGAGGRVDRLYNSPLNTMRRLMPHFGGGSSGGLIVNPGDLDGVFEQMQPWMRNARFTAREMENFNTALSELPEQNPVALERLIREQFDQTAKKHVLEMSGEERLAHLATRRFRKRAEEDRMYWVDEMGNPRKVAGAEQKVLINGEIVPSPSPALMAEYIGSAIPMPDPSELRRATAAAPINRLLNSENLPSHLIRRSEDVLTKITSKYWKPAVLLRPAYVLRVGMAEQARMAAMGMDSFMSDPVSAFAYAIGRRGDVELESGRLIEDSKQFAAAMNRRSVDHREGRAAWMRDGQFRAYSLADDEGAYLQGWANELQMVSEDPIVKHLLEHGKDATVDWLWDGKGRVHREALMTTERKRFALGRRGVDPNADDYIDSLEGHVDSVQEILDNLTGRDVDLQHAVRTGTLGNVSIPYRQWTPKERTSLMNGLRAKASEGIGPSYVRGTRDSEGLRAERRGFLDAAMDMILTTPTNKLSRAPAFKQSYWDNAIREAGNMNAATLEKFKSLAKQANLDEGYYRQLDQIKPATQGNMLDDWEAADLLFKDEALEQVKDLLYDPTIRGNFASLMRNIFPFAEAWKEEFQVWSRILKQNPVKPGFRLSQAWDFLRESDPLDPETPSQGRGFFYTGQYGDEVYGIPLGVLAPGARAPASAQQLSMMDFSTFLPGLGPVAQIPASMIINAIPDKHHWLSDALNDIVLPYGGPELRGEGLFGELVDRSLPSWARHMYSALMIDTDAVDDQEQGAAMLTKVLQSRFMTGDAVMPQSPQEMERVIRESARTTKALAIVEALMKGFMPSSPNVEFEMRDTSDRIWNANVLSDYYYELLDSYGEDAAVSQIIKQFGSGGLSALMLRGSQTMAKNAMTEGEFAWKREHRDFYQAHPEAAYHFTEGKKDGAFSFDAYNEAIREGTIYKLPIRDQMLRMNDRVGNLIYRQAQSQAEQIFGSTDTDEARLWLRERSIEIKRSLHGYGSGKGFEALEPEMELAYVAQALPEAPDTEVRDAIEEIIRLHDEANTLAAASGVANYYQSATAAPIRMDVLARLDDIVGRVPEAKSVADLIQSLVRGASEPSGELITWGDGSFGPVTSGTFGAVGQASTGAGTSGLAF